MTTLYLIGIGTGNPEHISREGARTLNQAEVILIPEKGDDKSDLADVRYQICDAVLEHPRPPILPFKMPVRDSNRPYFEAVQNWHDEIAGLWQDSLNSQNPYPKHVAMLVWGDPSLYDSTIRIAERLTPEPFIKIIPGITALQALCAAHKIPLNDVGAPFQVMTGRNLRDNGFPASVDRAFVMLDGSCSFTHLDQQAFSIYWGAYLGMDKQVLISGHLDDVSSDILAIRAQARAQHGWIMDSYLLIRQHNAAS